MTAKFKLGESVEFFLSGRNWRPGIVQQICHNDLETVQLYVVAPKEDDAYGPAVNAYEYNMRPLKSEPAPSLDPTIKIHELRDLRNHTENWLKVPGMDPHYMSVKARHIRQLFVWLDDRDHQISVLSERFDRVKKAVG